MSEEHQNPDWEVVDAIYEEFAAIVNKYREIGMENNKPLTFPEIDLVLWKMKLFRDQQFLELYMAQRAIDSMPESSGEIKETNNSDDSIYK